jgi:hypothetical protein
MCGHVTLWVPGIDHAGIATQSVVERLNTGAAKIFQADPCVASLLGEPVRPRLSRRWRTRSRRLESDSSDHALRPVSGGPLALYLAVCPPCRRASMTSNKKPSVSKARPSLASASARGRARSSRDPGPRFRAGWGGRPQPAGTEVERLLYKTEKKTRHDLGREKFLEKAPELPDLAPVPPPPPSTMVLGFEAFMCRVLRLRVLGVWGSECRGVRDQAAKDPCHHLAPHSDEDRAGLSLIWPATRC